MGPCGATEQLLLKGSVLVGGVSYHLAAKGADAASICDAKDDRAEMVNKGRKVNLASLSPPQGDECFPCSEPSGTSRFKTELMEVASMSNLELLL